MTERYLYGTAVPILLDGGRVAGRIARMLYVRFGLEPHCFGAKQRLLTRIYAKHHAALPFTPENDAVNLRLLKAFSAEWGTNAGILALIPCSPEAKSFLERARLSLDEDFIITDLPAPTENPLDCLLYGDRPAKE